MAHTYRLVGSQDPASRVDRVLVESPSDDYPQGKELLLGGDPVELNDDQVAKLSSYVKLEQVKSSDEQSAPLVDQPDVQRASTSTDVPPDPGTTPDIDSMNKDQLVEEVSRQQARSPSALQGVSSKSSKEELQNALRDHYGQGS